MELRSPSAALSGQALDPMSAFGSNTGGNVSLFPEPARGNVSLFPQPAPTPPVYGESGQNSQSNPQHDVAQEFARDLATSMARSAAQQGLGLLQRGAGEIRVYIEKNHYSVHVLSFCGGVGLTLVSFLGLMNIFAPLSGPLSYLLHLYQLAFGIVLCVIDGPGDKVPPRAKAAIVQYAPQLHNNRGRAAFYLFISCLEGSQEAYVHVLVGWYFLTIAVMFVALTLQSWRGGPSNMEEPMLQPLSVSECPPA